MSATPALDHNQASGDAITGTSKLPLKTNKRIIVCCDGAWQDGVVVKERWKHTNILKLSRAVHHHDARINAYEIPQIVFYQSGLETSQNLHSRYIPGIARTLLAEKVEEAYTFIAQNFRPGDEIFLFGFSGGAYTVRLVAKLIGAIGVLDKTNIGHLAGILIALQKLDKSVDPTEIGRLQAELAPWVSPTSRGKLRALSNDHGFSIKCVGIFDTVGSAGFPEEIVLGPSHTKSILGFSNSLLGNHIERAYQALAIHENRPGFNCNKFEQTQSGRRKGQVLKQCWFSGEHSDIGGGWGDHDLSDLALFWMVANIEDMLSLDLKYVGSLCDPVAPWGKQPPHDSRTGIFTLASSHTRQLPTETDEVTHETIHPSVLEQYHLLPQLHENIQRNPSLVCSLLPFEERIKRNWPYGKNIPVESKDSSRPESPVVEEPSTSSAIQSEPNKEDSGDDLINAASKSSAVQSEPNKEDSDNDILNAELPSSTPAPLFDYDEAPSPAASTHSPEYEIPPPGSSRDIPQPSDVQPAVSESPPEAPPVEPLVEPVSTAQSSQRSSKLTRWLQTRMKRSNGDPAAEENDRPSRRSRPSGSAEPKSHPPSPRRGNKGPSTFAAGKRLPRTVRKNSDEEIPAQPVNDASEHPAGGVYVTRYPGTGKAKISFALSFAWSFACTLPDWILCCGSGAAHRVD